MIPPEGEAADYRDGLNEVRRAHLTHGWRDVEHLAGRSPYYETPLDPVRRERLVQRAIESILQGSYAR